MRAKEFLAEASGSRDVTINIPITITIPNGGGDPVVKTDAADEKELSENLPPIPVWVNPLQQELELDKHKSGKRSQVINQIISDDGAYGKNSAFIEEELDINENFEQLTATYEHITESRNK
jgi:hypothetical protein